LISAFTCGLKTGLTSGKASFNSSDKPLFIEAFMFKILDKPE